MSRRRAYREETLNTINRFFEVLDLLLTEKRISSMRSFCEKYEIDRRHLYAQKEDHGKGFFEVYWLIPLIQDFQVSSDWLLLGKGKMFKK